MNLNYRTMTTPKRRLAVANELRRLTSLHGRISINKWNNMRDRSNGLPGPETVARLFNCTRWIIFRERALAYTEGDEVPGDGEFAATAYRDRRIGNQFASRVSRSDKEVAEAVEEMKDKATDPNWRAVPMSLIASENAKPYRYWNTTTRQWVETRCYGGGHFGHVEAKS